MNLILSRFLSHSYLSIQFIASRLFHQSHNFEQSWGINQLLQLVCQMARAHTPSFFRDPLQIANIERKAAANNFKGYRYDPQAQS